MLRFFLDCCSTSKYNYGGLKPLKNVQVDQYEFYINFISNERNFAIFQNFSKFKSIFPLFRKKHTFRKYLNFVSKSDIQYNCEWEKNFEKIISRIIFVIKIPIGEVALPSSGYSTRQMKPGMANHSGVPTEGLDHTLGLGELAGLTVTDEAGPLSDVSLFIAYKIKTL